MKFLTDIHGPQWMNPTDFGDPLTLYPYTLYPYTLTARYHSISWNSNEM